jgi:hypothetical protein
MAQSAGVFGAPSLHGSIDFLFSPITSLAPPAARGEFSLHKWKIPSGPLVVPPKCVTHPRYLRNKGGGTYW